jgi:hypothetical protein
LVQVRQRGWHHRNSMKLFKKIAQAAGAQQKKTAATAPKVTAAAEKAPVEPAPERKVATEAKSLDAESEPAANTQEKKKCQRGAVSSDEEVRLREVYSSLSKENQELKQRNRFLLQMLVVSQLDEKQLEKEIEEHQEMLMNSSMVSSESPVQLRMLAGAKRH